MPVGHFKRREEVPEKPNHNHLVAGANEPRATENYLLRKKADVAGKPNTNLLVRGAEEAPTSARVKPKQEVTAKPNMLDMDAHQFQWKVIGGVSGGDVGSASGANDGPRLPEQGSSYHHAAAAPMPLPQGYNPVVPLDNADEAAVGRWSSPPNQKRLEPIAHPPPPPAFSQHAAAPPEPTWPSAAAAPLYQQHQQHTQNGSPPYAGQMPSMTPAAAGGMPMGSGMYSASAADLERIVLRNYEEAQKTFLRV